MASLPYPRRPLNNSPTDFTDAHRWLGCVGFSHGIHGTHRSFWWRRASHGFHRCTQMVRLRRVLPRNSRNSQKLLAEKSLPRMRTDAHRWFGCVGFSHGIHGTHRSFWRRRASHRFHGCPQIVRLRMVLWEDSLVGSVGMAGMPYPPNLCPSVQSVGDYLALETSVDSVVSVGR